MSSSHGNPPPFNVFDDDDDFLDAEMAAYIMSELDNTHVGPIPQRNCPLSGHDYTQFLIQGHPRTIRDQLRMDVGSFRALAAELVSKNLIDWDNMQMSVEESLAITLYILGQGSRQRNAADRFQHSTETINSHFKRMLRALVNLAPDVIIPPNMDETPPEILNDDRYYPWFKDCIGAIDGTHVSATAPESEQTAYRGRKSTITQNVMAACSFDMRFTFVYSGWEGSAHDSRVFLSAATSPTAGFPHPPPNKYYLVDAGYTNAPGYLAPYRDQCYHLSEFAGRRRYKSPKELFNHKHSSLRNVIERCFGVLKARFPILKLMPNYGMVRQGMIVTACCVVHNWIIMRRRTDYLFDNYAHDDAEIFGLAQPQENVVNMSREQLEEMSNFRNSIAQSMWNQLH